MKINFEDILKIEKVNAGDYLKIQYQPTLWCNYRCFYCIQGSNNITKRKLTPKEKVYNTAKKIANKLNYYNGNLILSLIGGEITIPYDIKKIIKPFLSLDLKSFKLSITTNLSNNLEYYIDLLNYCKKNNIILHLVASYHYSNLDIFFNKVKELNKLKSGTVTIKIILTNLPKINGINPFEAYNKLIKIAKTVLIIGRIPNSKNHFFNIDLKTLQNIKKPEEINYNYTITTNKEEIHIKTLQNIKEYINEELQRISFKNFICDPDYLVIDSNENVSYGSCEQRRNETVLDNLTKLKPFPKICKASGCSLCGINKLNKLKK